MLTIKNIIECIAKPFTHICNQSLQTGICPEKMKIAKVNPIFKAGDKHQFSNYRPVFLLSQFSKILEKLFYLRMDDFITKHGVLCEQQYGFRANRTTSYAVLEFVKGITKAVENKEYAVGVFLDLKKAFDIVDHNLLF